jgi:hypothetical protein
MQPGPQHTSSSAACSRTQAHNQHTRRGCKRWDDGVVGAVVVDACMHAGGDAVAVSCQHGLTVENSPKTCSHVPQVHALRDVPPAPSGCPASALQLLGLHWVAAQPLSWDADELEGGMS